MQTRASLLLRIRNPQDGLAWSEFVNLYAPLLHSYALKHGLQDADAADLAQDALRNVLRAAPGFVYDPAKGSFRGWLFAVARNELRKQRARAARQAVGSGDSDAQEALASAPARQDERDAWDREYDDALFAWAVERVRPEFREGTWQAFWRSAVDGEPIERVAADLGMTRGALYIARSRVAARLREEIAATGDDR
jgi:RNA polymerase sigma-70 factor (ECF subfamily)